MEKDSSPEFDKNTRLNFFIHNLYSKSNEQHTPPQIRNRLSPCYLLNREAFYASLFNFKTGNTNNVLSSKNRSQS